MLDNTVTEVDGIVIAGISDPRFTPDKSADGSASLEGTGESLAATIRTAGRGVDLAMVHDPQAAIRRCDNSQGGVPDALGAGQRGAAVLLDDQAGRPGVGRGRRVRG